MVSVKDGRKELDNSLCQMVKGYLIPLNRVRRHDSIYTIYSSVTLALNRNTGPCLLLLNMSTI